MLRKMAKKLSETYLISEELLKLYSSISRNVGVDKLFPYIALAEPFFINPILGDLLVEELKEQIESDSLTELNKALIIKIAPCLALWTEYLAMRGLAYTPTEKGLTKEHSENSESLNSEEVGEYMLDIKNKAEMAQKLLIGYLCNCKDNYPLWHPTNECDCSEYVHDASSKHIHKFLFYFPRKENKCGKCNN